MAEDNEAIRSLCAFTHVQGGIVFFGVTDGGDIVGVTIGRNTIENFANKLQSNTQPSLKSEIYEIKINSKTVVAAKVGKASESQLFFAFNSPYIRIGKTNQVMSSEEVRNRFFKGFRAENLIAQSNNAIASSDESWHEREKRRVGIYESNQGLFLIHRWRPSSIPDQVADIIISLWQHGEEPLTKKTIKSVEYHLGSMFFDYTVVKTNTEDNFRLEVSAYKPMLCLAKVNFDDGTPPLDLERYIDFS